MTAQRIQRRRTKGWRMPDGAVYVGRPTRWSNPYRVGCVPFVGRQMLMERVASRADAVRCFRAWIDHCAAQSSTFVPGLKKQLAGRDLACWCALDAPCHADVLLEIANAGASAGETTP